MIDFKKINGSNIDLYSELYEIPIPNNMTKLQDKFEFFVKNFNMYDKVLKRENIPMIPKKDTFQFYTNLELINFYNLEIDTRINLFKKIKNLYNLSLLPRQVPHFNKITKTFNKYPFFIDTSKPGSGKTLCH